MRSHAKAAFVGSTPRRGIGTLGFALTVALLLCLTISPAAQAARGVVDSVGENGYRGGQFSFISTGSGATAGIGASVGGVGVNHTGNGSDADAGDVYVVDRHANRIEQFSSTGDFIRAWGYDVVGSGQNNTGANEQQTVTVPGTVSAGTFTLRVATGAGQGSLYSSVGNNNFIPNNPQPNEFRDYTTSLGSVRLGDTFFPNDVPSVHLTDHPPLISVKPKVAILAYLKNTAGAGVITASRTRFEARETTAPIPFNASAASVQAALEDLPGIDPGAVTVTGGPGASNPFTVTFTGAPFAGNDIPQMIATSSLTGGTASVATAVAGGAIEICQAVSSPADVCKGGTASPLSGALNAPKGIAVDQATGNVFVTDQGNRRVAVFGSGGSFQGAFGWGVDTGAAAFEFCTTASVCQAPAAAGAAAGQFGATMGHPAVAPAGTPSAGNVLVPSSSNNRIDEFHPTLTGEVVTGASFVRGFGWDTIPGAPTTLESCTSTCKEGTSGGGAGQFSSEVGATSVAVDTSGAIYALNLPTGANCTATARCVVHKFNPAATSATDFAPAQLTFTSGVKARKAATALSVDPSSGDVYVAQSQETEPPEVRVHHFDSAGNLLGTDLSGLSIGWQGFSFFSGNNTEGKLFTPVEGLAYDPSTGHTVLGTTAGDENAHLFFLGEIPASAKETLSASLADTPVTDVGADSAKLHGSLTPAQGMAGSTRYEFEYTNGSVWEKTPFGDAGNGSGTGVSDSCPEGNPTGCNVTTELTELEAGQDYRFRLHAYVPFNPDLSVTTRIAKFKIGGTGPSADTGLAWWSSPPATKPNLLFTGFVNPRNEVTSYYFQYVSEEDFLASGFVEASNAPAAPGDPAAQSFRTVEVQQTVYELDPSPAYRYRLVAVNPSGTTFGETRSVEPPNPGDRFYELVSNGDSSGLATGTAAQISDQGNRALFPSQIFEGQTAASTPVNPKVAQRTPSGWKVTPPALDPDYGYVGQFGSIDIGRGFHPSADLTKLVFEPDVGNIREQGNGRLIFPMAGIDGTARPATPLLEALTREAGVTGFGASASGGSADLSRLVIGAGGGKTLLPGEPLIPGGKPYVVNTDTLGLSLLNLDSAGNMIGGVCGAQLGGTAGFSSALSNAVSLDGSAMYFSARPGAPSTGSCSATVLSTFRTRIFKRENETATTEVSASQCTRPALPEPCKDIAGDDGYRAASADGDVVFFVSTRQLTDSDVDTAEDLYVYDSSPPAGQPTLVQATAGEATAGHPTVGSGAGFLGIVDFAADGSRVYFVSTTQLTADATAGQNNLFVYQRDEGHPAGRIEYVATLSNASGESQLWGSGVPGASKEVHALPSAATGPTGEWVYGDGRFLVFVSAAKLVSADTDSAKDLYRYSDSAGELLCLTCSGNEEGKPVGIKPRSIASNAQNPGSYQQGRIATEDVSKVVFETEEGLDPEDHNGVGDAYMWDAGQIFWISRDAGDFGSPRTVSSLLSTEFPTISLDGKEVFFVTSARLVASEVDVDTSPDLYSARIGGGFPAPKPEARICIDGEVCRGETTASPPLHSPSSSSLAGPGNEAAAKPRCRKGKVRKRGRCVKAKAKKKQHKSAHKRKAHRNARGSK